MLSQLAILLTLLNYCPSFPLLFHDVPGSDVRRDRQNDPLARFQSAKGDGVQLLRLIECESRIVEGCSGS